MLQARFAARPFNVHREARYDNQVGSSRLLSPCLQQLRVRGI